MSWEINLWEKTCKLEPNLFRSSSICLSLSLESISSIDYLSNIPNISLWDWFNEATHIWPQPEETSEDERNMSNESWKDLYGKEISLRIPEFIQFCNILKKSFFLSILKIFICDNSPSLFTNSVEMTRKWTFNEQKVNRKMNTFLEDLPKMCSLRWRLNFRSLNLDICFIKVVTQKKIQDMLVLLIIAEWEKMKRG